MEGVKSRCEPLKTRSTGAFDPPKRTFLMIHHREGTWLSNAFQSKKQTDLNSPQQRDDDESRPWPVKAISGVTSQEGTGGDKLFLASLQPRSTDNPEIHCRRLFKVPVEKLTMAPDCTEKRRPARA